jgi:hypothetical protein
VTSGTVAVAAEQARHTRPSTSRAFPEGAGRRPRVRGVAGREATSAFAGEPQPVEVYHRGIWYLGELLGWRHESDGRCLARVRCVVDGLRHSAWKDLADLRLPEPIAAEPEPEPGADDDATRPHVLLADLRTRPRPPAHSLVPPPRWAPAGPAAGDRSHLRRGSPLSRV